MDGVCIKHKMETKIQRILKRSWIAWGSSKHTQEHTQLYWKPHHWLNQFQSHKH